MKTLALISFAAFASISAASFAQAGIWQNGTQLTGSVQHIEAEHPTAVTLPSGETVTLR
jgi:hypothetical protein